MMNKKHYVIESWNLNDPNASHEFKITTEIPRGNSGDKPKITDGWLGSYNNITSYARGEFNSHEDAAAWIRENNDVVENEDGSFSEPETIAWEDWFVDGWKSYYNGEATVEEFISSLEEMASRDNDGNPMSVTDFEDDVSSWWEENESELVKLNAEQVI